MTPGIQEAIALGIVAIVVGFGLYRRWRKGQRKDSACCEEPSTEAAEKTVHFYRREDGPTD